MAWRCALSGSCMAASIALCASEAAASRVSSARNVSRECIGGGDVGQTAGQIDPRRAPRDAVLARSVGAGRSRTAHVSLYELVDAVVVVIIIVLMPSRRVCSTMVF